MSISRLFQFKIDKIKALQAKVDVLEVDLEYWKGYAMFCDDCGDAKELYEEAIKPKLYFTDDDGVDHII